MLARGVVVEAGAEVVDSVLLEDVVVRAGARVTRAVVDRNAVVTANVGGERDVALVGAGEHVTTAVPAGGRLPEDD